MKRVPGKPRGGKKGGVDPERARLRKKVDDVVARTGIPRAWAWQVARGDATLQQVLTRMAREDRVEQLVRRHGLDRSTAAQIADGHDDLSAALHRLRRRDHLARYKDRSVLTDALDDGRPLTVHLHGLASHTGRITAVDAYEFDLTDDAGTQRIHKLQLKLAHPADHKVKLGAVAGGRTAADPVPKPQDRFHMSDRRFFRHIDDGDRLTVTTLEGDVVVAVPMWISRWELGMQQKSSQVVVLRHAIAAVEVG